MAGAGASALRALRVYGDGVGLAFQIVDDILDLEGDPDRLGKTVGKDPRARKATFPALLGIAESRNRAEQAVRRAERALVRFGSRGRPLAALARFIIDRVS